MDESNMQPDEVFFVKIKAGSRVYFLNLKEDRNRNYYLVIKESKPGDPEFRPKNVMVFEEDLDKLIDGLQAVKDFIKSQDNQTNSSTQSENSAT